MIDFAEHWNQIILANKSARHLEAVDTAFWEASAAANAAWTRRTPCTLEALRNALKRSNSLLEVGAGTGRFALQLAPYVERVTALDYSSAMLEQLRKKQTNLSVSNVEAVLGNLMTTQLEPHDTVLAAWSLYSSADILATLERLLSLTQKQLIILDDDSSGSPHRQLRTRLWEPPRPVPMPKYLVLTGALWQLGVRSNVRIVRETRTLRFTDREALLYDLCPQDADYASRQVFLEQLGPYLSETQGGLTYAYPFEVAMIYWQQES